MKKIIKKGVLRYLAALLLIVAMLAGCAGKKDPESTGSQSPGSSGPSGSKDEEKDNPGTLIDADILAQENKDSDTDTEELLRDGLINVRNPKTVNWDGAKSIVQTAIDNKTMIIQAMSGEGCYIPDNSSNTYMWGDAVLLAFPNGQTMLIDSGIYSYGWLLVENLKKLGIEKLDYVMMSHMHSDHYGGFIEGDGIFENFKVDNFIWSGIYAGSYGLNDQKYWMENAVDSYGIKQIIVAKGDVMRFGDVKMTILYPEKGLAGKSSPGTNDEADNAASIVARFDYGEFSYLTAGDLYVKAESEVLSKVDKSLLSVDVAKADHHGGASSNCDAWCEALKAKVVFQTGCRNTPATVYESYAKVGSVFYVDTYDGYVRIEGKKDGSFTAGNSRERKQEAFDKIDAQYNIVRKSQY